MDSVSSDPKFCIALWTHFLIVNVKFDTDYYFSTILNHKLLFSKGSWQPFVRALMASTGASKGHCNGNPYCFLINFFFKPSFWGKMIILIHRLWLDGLYVHSLLSCLFSFLNIWFMFGNPARQWPSWKTIRALAQFCLQLRWGFDEITLVLQNVLHDVDGLV